MRPVSWYETLEGKLAMCLAALLIALSLIIARSDMQTKADPSAEEHSSAMIKSYEETRASNLAELPPLTPYAIPEPPIQAVTTPAPLSAPVETPAPTPAQAQTPATEKTEPATKPTTTDKKSKPWWWLL